MHAYKPCLRHVLQLYAMVSRLSYCYRSVLRLAEHHKLLRYRGLGSCFLFFVYLVLVFGIGIGMVPRAMSF